MVLLCVYRQNLVILNLTGNLHLAFPRITVKVFQGKTTGTMSSTYTPLKVKDIEAIVEIEGLDQMTGRPSPGSLINIINQLSQAFQTIHCPYSAFGMLYIVLPPRVCTVVTGETVNPPSDPGAIPLYLHGGYASTNHVILLTWQNQKEAHQIYLRCNQVAIAKTKWALPADIRAALTQLSVGNPDRIFVLFLTVCIKNMDATLTTTTRPTAQE